MILTLVLLANLWIYKIFFTNFLLGVVIVVATLLLFYKRCKFFLAVFVILLIFQAVTTQKASLTNIANDDRRLIDLRLRAYPPKFLRIGHWLEERKESIAEARISKNLFENLDPNLYFFANHPKERVGIKEFEKFPYVFLPFFLFGLIEVVKKWDKNKLLLISFFVPLVLLSVVGNLNKSGPFTLFPFFTITTSLGLKKISKPLLVILVLVLIQMIAYEIY